MTEKGPYIGIDLGTTFSSVAVYQPDTKSVQVIKIDNEYSVPSIVGFGSEIKYGKDAQKCMRIYPETTLYDSKRMIGKTYDELRDDIKNWPFRVSNFNGNPFISLKFKGQARDISPAEISSYVLSYLKKKAQDALNADIRSAVITVPAYFTDRQKSDTKLAAKMAGFQSFKLMTEPTAAALNFMRNIPSERRNHKVLVYDFGGGTFDVSLVNIKGNKFDVLGYNGDSHLGGQDINNKLVEYFYADFRQFSGVDIYSNSPIAKRYLGALTERCEEIKKEISTGMQESTCDILLDNHKRFQGKITKDQFNRIIKPIIDLSFIKIDDLMRELNFDASTINEIVLVGGTSLIPVISDLIYQKYHIAPRRSENQLEAVACGAAIKAYINAKTSKKSKSKKPKTTQADNYENPYANLPDIVYPDIPSSDTSSPVQSIDPIMPDLPEFTFTFNPDANPFPEVPSFEPLFPPPPDTIEYPPPPDNTEEVVEDQEDEADEQELDIDIHERTSHSIGIVVNGKVFRMINKGEEYLIRHTQTFQRASRSKQYIIIKVVQGESVYPEECQMIGHYKIMMPDDEDDVRVTMVINSDGILSVQTFIKGESKYYQIANESTRLTDHDIDRIQTNRRMIRYSIVEEKLQNALELLESLLDDGNSKRVNRKLNQLMDYMDEFNNAPDDSDKNDLGEDILVFCEKIERDFGQ